MKIPAWEGLTRIGRSRLISLTIFVPVVGYLIIFNENVIQLLELSKALFPDNGTNNFKIWFSNLDRLFYIYFGLMLLGLASILYQLYCPTLIKEHRNDRNYIRDEINLMTGRRTNSLLKFLSERIPEEHNKYKELKDLSDLINRYHQQPESYQEGTRDRLNTDLMLIQWQNENWTYILPRIIISLFYFFGFVLLSIPSAELFLRVSSILIN